MALGYEDAVAELFQTPHAAFVGERKRLGNELKAAGDKAGAARLAKLTRPPISAWVVNQLWWHARDAFDTLLATAARLRDGDLAGTAAHREALAVLRSRASAILSDAGNAAAESTLRRVATTLSAIAAAGGFAPDRPGELTDDRDPPGFEAAGIPAPAKPDDTDDSAQRARDQVDAARQTAEHAEAAAERRRAEQAAAHKLAERHRYEAALRTANGDVERRSRDVERLRKAVADAEVALDKAKAIAADLEAKLAE